MNDFPQLRVRSGYSWRTAYGRIPDILARLKELGTKTAAMVDSTTFGHVRYEQATKKSEVQAAFGMEIPIRYYEQQEGEKKRAWPAAWMIATDTRKFYNATSRSVQQKGLTPFEFSNLPGVIKFSGGATGPLLDADYGETDAPPFDYIDVNPSSLLHAAQQVRAARRTGIPLVLTSYNDMPRPEHTAYAYAWEVRDSVGMRHIASPDEMWEQLRFVMTREEFDRAVQNAYAIEERLQGITLAKAPMIHLDGDLHALARAGQAYRLERGHIKEWTQTYEDRFVEELKQIQAKDFDSYFLVVSDLIAYAKKHMLVGPGRGSSAGSLICYCLGITEVDPLPHALLFQRFIDISRSDLPDIDIDFADTKRYMVFDYLREKYGIRNTVKLGNINTLKAASVIAQVGKKFGIHINETSQIRNSLIEYSSADERYGKGLEDTLSKTEPGKEFRLRNAEAADCMGDLELHPSHAGVHAAGILVCNDPVDDFCTVNEEGVAQLDKPDSEYLNLLKIDALGLRTLGVIEDAGVVTGQELYDLPLDDKAVLDILNEDKMSGVFQFEGQAVRSVTNLVNVTSFSNIDHITALARPGPLSSGMANKYVDRVAGREPVTFDAPELEPYLKDTYGVFLYQEQIMSVVKEIGLFDWVKTSAIRKAMSGRKGEEYFNSMGEDFVKGALQTGVEESVARKIWQEMVTFGAWGFNRSHSVSYAVVTYWTCWMKRYHKLEYAAAALRAAKDDEQTIAILRELAAEGIEYTPIDPEYSDMNWVAADGRLIGGIMNAKGFGPVKAEKYIEARKNRDSSPEARKLFDKMAEQLAKAEVEFADLREAHTKWGPFYDNPRAIGVLNGDPIENMKDIGERKEGLFIGKLTQKILSDENEPIRVKKRGGKLFKGQSQFLDLKLVDDSTNAAMRCRIRPDLFLQFGKSIAEGAPVGSWFLVRGWRISGLEMFIVKKIKRLDTAMLPSNLTPEEQEERDLEEKDNR
ncbi:DNA polymerase III subunit alpha [Burkholderia phage vB_BglM_WTB]